MPKYAVIFWLYWWQSIEFVINIYAKKNKSFNNSTQILHWDTNTILGTVYLMFQTKTFLFVRGRGAAFFNPPFNTLPTWIKYLKSFLNLRKSVQNIQRILKQAPYMKEQIWLILNCPVHCLRIITHRKVFCKINLFKNCI